MAENSGAAKAKIADDLYLADWAEQMAQVMKAGLTVEDGLELLQENAAKGSNEEQMLSQMVEDIRIKGDLSAAMESAGIFPKEMIRMVTLGERTGNLERILYSLKNQYSRQDALKKSIRTAVVYPLGISAVMVAMIAVILIFVMPVFKRAYAALGIEMSGLSRILLNVGSWLGGTGLPILIGILLILLLVMVYEVQKSRREGEIPFSRFLRGNDDLNACEFAGTMALCFAGGITTEEGLEMAEELNDDAAFGEKLKDCKERTEKGERFYEAAKNSGIFRGRQARRIQMAEKTAELDVVMQEIADDLQTAVDQEVNRRVGRIEPILILVLTIVSAMILFAVMLPLLGIMSTI